MKDAHLHSHMIFSLWLSSTYLSVDVAMVSSSDMLDKGLLLVFSYTGWIQCLYPGPLSQNYIISSLCFLDRLPFDTQVTYHFFSQNCSHPLPSFTKIEIAGVKPWVKEKISVLSVPVRYIRYIKKHAQIPNMRRLTCHVRTKSVVDDQLNCNMRTLTLTVAW